jgi:uncharacterized phage protein (TIGR01671 family)
MREIKFRAWDGKRSEIIYFDFQLLHDESRMFYNEQIKGNHIMQFTGLHDKNGREIYEGDIVSAAFYENPLEILTIEWVHSGFLICDKPGKGYPLNIHGLHDIAVEGNIHENPELLKAD